MKTEALGSAVLRVELLHILLVIGAWAAFLPTRLIEPWALFVGAIFMGVNFLLLSCGIRWVLTPFAGKGRVRSGIALLVLKLALFLGLVSVLLFRIELDPLSFALGFSSLLVAIVVDRLWAFSSLGG
jgi:hypothetical protein